MADSQMASDSGGVFSVVHMHEQSYASGKAVFPEPMVKRIASSEEASVCVPVKLRKEHDERNREVARGRPQDL